MSIFFGLTSVEIRWIYWFEGIILGIFALLTIVYYVIVEIRELSKLWLVLVFLIPYCVFLLFSFMFLFMITAVFYALMYTDIWLIISGIINKKINELVLPIILSGIVLGYGHLNSFIKNILEKRKVRNWDVIGVFSGPYLRIIPMWGGAFVFMLLSYFFIYLRTLFFPFIKGGMIMYAMNILFLFLIVIVKTFLDLRAHIKKHGFKDKKIFNG